MQRVRRAPYRGKRVVLKSSGGAIGSGGYKSQIVGRKVCFTTPTSGRYEVKLDNGMVCAAAARKSTGAVGFAVDRQTCTAPTSGNPLFDRIQPFTATCERRAATSLSCRTAFEQGSSGGPFVFTAQ